MNARRYSRQHRPAGEEGVEIGLARDAVNGTAPWFLQPGHQNGDDEAGRSGDGEGKLPASEPQRGAATDIARVPPLRGNSADEQRPAKAEGYGSGDDRHDQTAPLLGKIILGQARASRLGGRFAYADAQAGQHQGEEAPCKSRPGGRDRPETDACRQ